MKKTLIMGIVCLSMTASYAQTVVEPKILEEFYAQKISPNGTWLYSDANTGETIIYNLETDKYNLFYNMSLGNGNAIALDGTAVGSSESGRASIFKGSKAIIPSSFSGYAYSSINGITADASRIVGIVSNNRNTGTDDEENQMYFPYVADIDADGKCKEITILPHPDKDFFGLVPQYSSATWVSNDGKTILGQLIDYSGMFLQPIVYRQDEAGEWSYTLPTKDMFNPYNIEVPEFPEFDYSLFPEPTNFMTEEMKALYEEDIEYWRDHYMEDPDLPYPGDFLEDYMTHEGIMAYNEAVEIYNDYVYVFNEEIELYYEARNAILDSSVSFVQNASTMNQEGTIAALTGKIFVETGSELPMEVNNTYLIDLVSDEVTMLNSKYTNIYPQQVLTGGLIVGATPTAPYIATYVYVPGAEDYVPVEEYMAAGNPGAVEWMKLNLMHELITGGDNGGIQPYSAEPLDLTYDTVMLSGLGMASEDFSVFAGAVTAYMYDPVLYYMTYVFRDLTSGVQSVSVSDDSVVKPMRGGVLAVNDNVTDLSVVDLSGRKVFGVHNAVGNVETNLKSGIYIVTFIDAQGQRVSMKVNF